MTQTRNNALACDKRDFKFKTDHQHNQSSMLVFFLYSFYTLLSPQAMQMQLQKRISVIKLLKDSWSNNLAKLAVIQLIIHVFCLYLMMAIYFTRLAPPNKLDVWLRRVSVLTSQSMANIQVQYWLKKDSCLIMIFVVIRFLTLVKITTCVPLSKASQATNELNMPTGPIQA